MNVIKRTRLDNHYTQQEIADVLGITQAAYSAIELGKRGLQVRFAKLLGKHYGVNWWRFYDDPDITDEL